MKLIKLILITLMFSSCSKITYKTLDHSISLNKETTFCIANDEDKFGTIRDLKQIFEDEGFHIVPFENASKAMKNKKTNGNTLLNKDIERAFNIKNIDSVFAIILNYNNVNDIIGTNYKNFRYSIVNLNTGKTVAWGFAIAEEMNTSKKTLRIFVKKLKQKLSK